MDIREKIGNRIVKARKELGISVKELAARTERLSPQRISNWEQGTRSPGPLEALLIARQLNVSPSYLLCLTDSPSGEITIPKKKGMQFIPVVPLNEALTAKAKVESNDFPTYENVVMVDEYNKARQLGAPLFAVQLDDASMKPEFDEGDIIVIAAGVTPKPCDYVLVFLPSKNQTVLRKYREADDCLFKLLANNEFWATLNVKKADEAIIIGVMVERRQYY